MGVHWHEMSSVSQQQLIEQLSNSNQVHFEHASRLRVELEQCRRAIAELSDRKIQQALDACEAKLKDTTTRLYQTRAELDLSKQHLQRTIDFFTNETKAQFDAEAKTHQEERDRQRRVYEVERDAMRAEIEKKSQQLEASEAQVKRLQALQQASGSHDAELIATRNELERLKKSFNHNELQLERLRAQVSRAANPSRYGGGTELWKRFLHWEEVQRMNNNKHQRRDRQS
jgi:chromosome segregation ATPase